MIGLLLSAHLTEARTVAFTLQGDLQTTAAPVEIWLPLPQDTPHQRVLDLHVEASIPGAIIEDPVYHNRAWHGRSVGADPVWFAVRAKVERVDALPSGPPPTPEERDLFLRPNARVPVSGPLLEPILNAVPKGPDPRADLRHIFDWVLDNMTYKKVGEGWGTGSTEWACSARYGNCTDFHALVISLTRSRGLPARFHIGYPLDDTAGPIEGYHCWADVWIDGEGWLPIDASEAWKHKEERDRWFAHLPDDRVELSIGRDLVLGQAGPPLNFFVAPYAEQGGTPVDVRFQVEQRPVDLSVPAP